MAKSETFVFRAPLAPKIYRAFEIADTSSLYAPAQAIVRSFDFDHAFGFYLFQIGGQLGCRGQFRTYDRDHSLPLSDEPVNGAAEKFERSWRSKW